MAAAKEAAIGFFSGYLYAVGCGDRGAAMRVAQQERE